MIGMTLCSGIGAPEVAAPWIDWRFASEIEAFPRAVLAERFGYKLPEDHNQGDPLLWGDMTEITPELLRERGVPLPELIVAGTPCQAFSIAGLRKGLSDARGNLTMKFVEICHAIVDARPDGKFVAVWENVPGVLSDKENAFGNFLGALVGGDDAIPNPEGGGWPSQGMVEGPRARLAWGLLDAQHFGVPQRRRRVFLVASFGASELDPAKVLFEPKGVCRDIETGGKEGKDLAVYSQTGIGKYSEDCGTLRASGGDLGGGHSAVAYGLQANTIGRKPENGGNGLGASLEVSPTLTKTDRHAVAFMQRSPDGGAPRVYGEVTQTLDTMSEGQREPCVAIGYNPQSMGMGFSDELSPTLSASNYKDPTSVFVKEKQNKEYAVRRLTPVECHRLQGFPDDHCAITYRGKPASDGPQYKALGNSMAVPVVRWLLARISQEMAI